MTTSSLKLYERYIGNESWKKKVQKENNNHKSTKMSRNISSHFNILKSMPIIAWPTDQRKNYSYNKCLLYREFLTEKNHTSILNSSGEVDVSIFLHLYLL